MCDIMGPSLPYPYSLNFVALDCNFRAYIFLPWWTSAWITCSSHAKVFKKHQIKPGTISKETVCVNSHHVLLTCYSEP
uniref:Uncharacterized protein n=1 Tax=Arundo donax TaxID=35708 RepID=A0A0A9HS21_ARUDO